MTTSYDQGDPEPVPEVIGVLDYTAPAHPDDQDSDRWGRTQHGWKGYKNGSKVYLDWPELVRRWGPVTELPKPCRREG
jgi:hypothetical protein